MEWQGAWNKDTDYKKSDVVTQGGGTYVALNATKGTPPPSDAWGVVAAPPPAAINWKGPWVATVEYKVNDAVSYEGSSQTDVNSYIAVNNPPKGTLPTNQQFWQALSSNKEIQQSSNLIAAAISAGGVAFSALIGAFSAWVAWKTLQGQVATAVGEIATQAGLIATNTGQIAKAVGDVQKLDGDVKKTIGDVQKNTGDILKNTQDFQELDTDVKRNSGNLKKQRQETDTLISREQQRQESKHYQYYSDGETL